jgi:transposase
MQVRYEMLRRVSVDDLSVTQVSDEYGVSRPTYYQAKASFGEAGLAGLVPKKKGPHGPHKLSREPERGAPPTAKSRRKELASDGTAQC